MSRILARLAATPTRPALTVELATTDAARDTAARLRKRIYVDELRTVAADHPFVHGDRLCDPYDAHSHHLILRADGRPCGTLRVTIGTDGPLEIEAYTDASAVLGADRNAAEVTRMMVTRDQRRGPGARLMLLAVYRLCRERGVARGLCAGKVGNLGRYYRNFGFTEHPGTFTYDLVGDARYRLLSVDLGTPGSLAWWRWTLTVPVLQFLAFSAPNLGERWFRRGFRRKKGSAWVGGARA